MAAPLKKPFGGLRRHITGLLAAGAMNSGVNAPPQIDQFEQSQAAGTVNSDQQKNNFQPYENENEGGSLAKDEATKQSNETSESPEDGQSPEQQKIAAQMEQDRQRKNMHRDDLNQSMRPIGFIKGLYNRKEIRKLTEQKEEKEAKLKKINEKINKLKLKWWQVLRIIFELIQWILGYGVVETFAEFIIRVFKVAEQRVLKKDAKTLKKEIEKIGTEIYNRQNVIKLEAQQEVQAEQQANANS